MGEGRPWTRPLGGAALTWPADADSGPQRRDDASARRPYLCWAEAAPEARRASSSGGGRRLTAPGPASSPQPRPLRGHAPQFAPGVKLGPQRAEGGGARFRLAWRTRAPPIPRLLAGGWDAALARKLRGQSKRQCWRSWS